MTLSLPVCLLGFVLSVPYTVFATEEIVALPKFRVDGTPWQYAKSGEIEILTSAPIHRTRALVTALLRGLRLFPDFYTASVRLPLVIIQVEERDEVIASLEKPEQASANERFWRKEYSESRGVGYDSVERGEHLLAANFIDVPIPEIMTIRARRLIQVQRPEFAPWTTVGLLGPCSPYQEVIGLPKTATIQIAKLSWPDPALTPEVFPNEAADFLPFSTLFDSHWDLSSTTPKMHQQFDFQTGLFARWSLFGPAKNGRNRNGYWALAEMARRGPVTETLFEECIGMTYAKACAEMRAYLKTPAVGMLNVRLKEVMAAVPEAESLEFRVATPAEVTRILSESKRLLPRANRLPL